MKTKYYVLVLEGVTVPKKLTLNQATMIAGWLDKIMRVKVMEIEL